MTVLFADLSGYTKLSSTLDPEDVHHLLERFFAKTDGAIAELGGTIDKHIGDNVMALFGAPVAHDNDPERAVRAALEIHARAAALSAEVGFVVSVHIGIASGEVVASGLGSQHHQAYTVIGDAANLAARLQDKATASETFVSDPVYRATRHLARYQAVGELEVKGLALPVSAWKLLGLGLERAPAGPAFVGRRAEMARLRSLLEDVHREQRGALVHIRGEAGIGKTRLTHELSSLAVSLGFQAHNTLILDFGVAASRDPVRSIAESLLGISTRTSAAERERRVEEIGVGTDMTPFVRDLIGLGKSAAAAHSYEQMDHGARAESRKRAFCSLLERAAQTRPTLVLVENLHWSDELTLASMVALAHAAASCPAVIVFTTRVEGDPLSIELHEAVAPTPVAVLELGPLQHEDAATLAAAAFGADTLLAMRCVERAGGNPLFLVQLLENTLEGGGDKLPDSLQSLVLARADRLSEAHRQALTAASVIGQRFSLSTLRALLDDPAYVPEALVSHNLLRPDGEELLFQHALIRDGVYSSLTRAHRRLLHAKAAEHFRERDVALYAEHLERAEDDRAPRAYLVAARAQADGFFFERAFRSLESALSLARHDPDRFAVCMARGDLALEVGDAKEALSAYTAALAAADGDLDHCHALIGRAAAFRRLSEHARGLPDLDEAEEIAARLGAALELAQVHYYRGCLYFALSKREQCLVEHQKAVESAERASSALWQARALSGLGDADYALGRTDAAAGHYQRCLELCERNDFDRIAIPNRLMLLFSAIFEGRLVEVTDVAPRVLETALRFGDRHGEMFAHHLLSLGYLLRGDTARAREPAERALELSRAIHARRFEAEFMVVMAEVQTLSGRLAEARELVLPALAIARETGIGYVGPWALALLAFLCDDPNEERGYLRESEDLLDGDAMFYNHFFHHRWAIELGIRAGDFDQVERQAQALIGKCAGQSLRLFRFIAERGLVWAAWGRGERSEALRARIAQLEATLDLFSATFALPEL